MPKVLTITEGAVFIVQINRPEVRNAIDADTAHELYQAFLNFDKSKELRVAVLTGSKDCFCSGADLKTIATDSEEVPRLDINGRAPLGISRMVLSKPVIAAVEGHAVAGGLELALWCDIRIAAKDAIFGVYCRRFGVPLVDGGTVRLPRIIGHGRAMDLILTGRPVKADEAYQIGLVNRLVAHGQTLNAAVELAHDLSKLPQKCMRSDRLSAMEQWGLNAEDALKNESVRGQEVINSGETQEGAQRFVSKDF